jgi:fructosamine-3-kinase
LSPDFAGIAAAISESTGNPFVPRVTRPVSGGSIHGAWELADGDRRFFVKTNLVDSMPMFAAEAFGLETLSKAAVVPTPTIVATGRTEAEAFLVLEYLELAPLDQAGGTALGKALARLHRSTADAFGWTEDNFIGATPQRNTWHVSWPYFFGEYRLRPQLEFALGNGIDKTLAAKGAAVIERIGGLFVDYRPLPSLLHGDLWSGNAAQRSDGSVVIFDPACYYGDRETDIAMSELFGGFPTSFHAAYRAEWPLDSGYESRKPLYNLYHILNHFNLFGSAYLGQAQRMIGNLLTALTR